MTNQGHPHWKIMQEYAEVAKTNPKPWQEFEFCGPEELASWKRLDTHPDWLTNRDYRHNPKPKPVMTIGSYKVEACPVFKNNADLLTLHKLMVWSSGKFGVSVVGASSYIDKELQSGVYFATHEEAAAVAGALNAIYQDAIASISKE